MNTAFEIAIDHPDGAYARQAARAAFGELDRLETALSLFIDGSAISRLNRAPAGQSVQLGRDACGCLSDALLLHSMTFGAFDVSLGTGLSTLSLDPSSSSARKATGQTRIDLGGIGKGYALDQLVGLLEEWEINRACLIGGGSSVLALDPPEGLSGWPVGLGSGGGSFQIVLSRASVGASGTGAQGEHIHDPADLARRLPPRRSWVCARTATWSDAFATAFMVLPEERIEFICRTTGELAALIEHDELTGTRCTFHGHPALKDPP